MKAFMKRSASLFLVFCLLLSLVTALPTFAEKPDYPSAVGDIYVDGEVSTKDGIYLLQYLANMVTIPEEHLFAANTYIADDAADGTPQINTKDAILLLQYLAKMNVQLGDPNAPIPPSPANEEQVAKNLKSVLDSGIRLGGTYDIGITAATRAFYTLQGADGFLCINEDGLLEVIGIKGRSEKLQLLNKSDEQLLSSFYTVENSILCTNIKLALLDSGRITSRSDDVPHSMLSEITEMDLSGILVNDTASAKGVGYLTGLTSLNLSGNSLSDVSFISHFENLTSLDLSNNEIKSLDYILDNRGMRTLDVSGNQISDISDLRHMSSIRYLDISDNNVTDITPLSTMYDLESLHISNNKLTVFRDPLSGLENLKELSVGYCNISFNDIISLRYLSNLTHLDVSGTDPSLYSVSTLTNLRALILDDCKLGSKDLSQLNTLTHLEYLSVANNRMTMENFGAGLSPESLTELNTLAIGGNDFIDVPDLSGFTNLKHLDLTYSYNLLSIDSITSLPLETLILDHCTSLSVEDGGAGFLESLNALSDLKRLSIVSGFNFVTRESYRALEERVAAGNLTLRFLTDRWVDSSTVHNYSKAVFFSVEELIGSSTLEDDGSYTVSFGGTNRQIVLSLLNDPDATANYQFNIPSGFFQMDIYGSKYETYHFKVNVLPRRESTFTLDLFDFKSVVGTGTPVTAPTASKLTVKAMRGECYLEGGDATPEIAPGSAISAYDLFLASASDAGATLSLRGGDGYKGADGYKSDANWDAPSKTGKRGGDGAHAIIGHNVTLDSDGITAIGGNGGQGGRGGDGANGITGNILNHGSDGGRGGDGGTGGAAICSTGTVVNPYTTNTLTSGGGGSAGAGGKGEGLWELGTSRGPGNPGGSYDPIYYP